MSLEQAFHTPRIDASARADIRVDTAMPQAFIDELAGHYKLEIATLSVFPKLYACPGAVMRDPVSGLHYGMSDPSAPIAAARAEKN
jgi:gamma-glutamyltranspeptidase/glutathione hydrolase